jgi:lysophospholipase L1-like esterase
MRGRLREALAILLLGIALLLLLEVGLRLAGWPTERVRTFAKLLNFDAQVWNASIGVFQPSSRATVMWPPELAYGVEINSLGLRGPEIARTPPPGTTRVLAVGDSQTFGFYLENDQTWPARLEARLRADGSEVEVVNAGVGGWSIDSETLFLIERGLALQPQVVLLGYCGNDIADLAAAEPRYEGQKRLVGSGSGPLARAFYTSALYELHLRGMVALNQWKRKTFGDSREGALAPSLSPERNEALWASYAR